MWSILDGEWILNRRENGGATIALRSLWTGTLLFLAAVAVNEAILPGGVFSLDAARAAVHERMDWYGAILAGTYLAFHSRFSSQWTYLAGVYNQLMATMAQSPDDGTTPKRSETYALWKAAFIEDAEDLHLAGKASFAGVIASLLAEDAVRDAYRVATREGEQRVLRLEERVNSVLGGNAVANIRAYKAANRTQGTENAKQSTTSTP
ncbi:MAG TPA: hypothetical protein VEA99_08210 [Gemmatimonadaceae bacterium]|nr:hypothetical protein [Gemmatimonadaceae bacterium]